MSIVIMEAKGNNGQLELTDSTLRIKRQGFSAVLSHGFKGDREIPISQISSVEFKKAGVFSAGYLQIALIGVPHNKPNDRDENTVTFFTNSQPAFEAIRDELQSRMVAAASGSKPATPFRPATPPLAQGQPTKPAAKGNPVVGCLAILVIAIVIGAIASSHNTDDSSQKASSSAHRAIGESFALGDFTYRVDKVRTAHTLGNEFTHQTAAPEATYVIVYFSILNNANETKVVLTDDFTLVDPQGRRYSPSSEANTALMMTSENKDFLLSELHPGVTKRTATAFEIPKDSLTSGLYLEIPEKGLLSTGKETVTIIK